MASGVSILKPRGYQQKNSCGYCKNGAGSANYYMSCDNLRVDHYQELVDRGWRRSGKLYYKPDLPRSCCPQYTIRLDATAFRAKKTQRQAVNRWNRFVLGADYGQKVKILNPLSRDEKRQRRDKFDLANAVHAAEYPSLNRPTSRVTKRPIEPDHKFEVNLEADSFTKEKYDIFLKYQVKVHKDPKSRWGHADLKRFLCSGLGQKTLQIEDRTQKLGSYHQCYRLDGKLVAVGVLDLLPHAVSSVYLLFVVLTASNSWHMGANDGSYDPDFEAYEFGKISALREVALALEGQYQYYYMGFYIHTCIKMRYKANFEPSYLLDPETLHWNPFDAILRQKLDGRSYVSPSRDARLGVGLDPQASSQNETQINEQPHPANLGSKIEKVTNSDELQVDSDSSDVEDAEIPEGSLFEYQIPGVLSRAEVEMLDLNHWKLVVRNSLVDLEDLRGWETWKIDDPYSIKGIAAELAATVGPNLLKDTAISIF